MRVFLEEFRDLAQQKSGPDGGAGPVFPRAERELLLKCLFIKHFLSDDFEKLMIGADLADSFRFQLSGEVKAALGELDPRAPDSVTLLYLFNVRRQLHGAGEMRNIMEAILEDSGNYNRLVALSMLEFDYTDIWRDIQAAEQPGARQGPVESVANDNRLNSLMVRAEQIGNEDISSIGRERNNERINRVMWNLLANGASELANPDAYVRHFQELVLAAAPENRQAAWESFLSDGYHGRIYKDNVTRNRLSVDMYLPLFQGFRVTGAGPEQWLKLLDFYFRSEEGAAITAEMLQNLNCVDITDHRVYLCVLNRFSQCGIIGNLNREPCMYQFLRQTLRMAFTLGYTRQFLFHDLWYLPDEPAEFGGLMPSKQWKDAVLGMAKEFEAMKRGLERDRQDDPRLSWFNAGIDAIIAFIGKCGELIAAERSIGMRTPNVKVKESRTVSRHEDLCNTLQEQLRAGMDLNEWYEQIHSAFDRGELDPSEVRKLVAQAEEQPV